MYGMSLILENLYWVGIKESEIAELKDLIAGSVTIFGSGKGKNRAYDKVSGIRYDYNQDIPGYVEFLKKELGEILLENPHAKFLFYDNLDLYCDLPEMEPFVIGRQDRDLLMRLNSKCYVKELLSDTQDLLPGRCVSALEIGQICESLLACKERFVIQGDVSCGGVKTYLLDQETLKPLLSGIHADEKYYITPYQENNTSVNVHIIVYDDEVLVTPVSVQLLDGEDGRFLYTGGDFVAAQFLPQHIKEKVREKAYKVGIILQKKGYRGVCGVDFLAAGDGVYFMEINPRFQSSTFLMNKALKENHLPIMQEMHIEACGHGKSQDGMQARLNKLQVNYSFYQYSKKSNKMDLLYFMYQKVKDCIEIEKVLDDGLDWSSGLEEETYLYRIVFHTNIADIGATGKTRIHPAVNLRMEIPEIKYTESDLIKLKILLFNHGIRIEGKTREYLRLHGGIKFEEFDAINATIFGHIRMSIPYQARFTSLSPFSVKLQEGETYLCYLEKQLCKIEVAPADLNYYKKTRSGTSYSDICYMNYDRLRINFHSGCYFKYLKKGCQFCDVEAGNLYNQFEDIKEVVRMYGKKEELRHYLIGGGSGIRAKDFTYALEIVQYIYETVKKPVYIMTTPPKDLHILDEMKRYGVTEVAFNIEIFDRKRAVELMPGKGKITLDEYAAAFEHAVKLWGNDGQVRSALIVGLESPETFLEGVEWLCAQGVSPMLSPFRPYYNTLFENRLPEEDEEIIHLYYEAKKICDKYGMILGPSCPDCEDNTIKITL